MSKMKSPCAKVAHLTCFLAGAVLCKLISTATSLTSTTKANEHHKLLLKKVRPKMLNGKEVDPISEFRFCLAEANSQQYFCNGTNYDEFAGRMHHYVLDLNRTNIKPTMWGRRSSPSPFANTTILFFGNSHTRQTFMSLACQYKEEQVSYKESGSKLDRVAKLVLPNNITLVDVSNHYLVYSSNWAELLRDATGGYGLDSFNAIVLGRFNDMANAKGTNFAKWISNVTITNGAGNFSFEDHSPPGVRQVVDAFTKNRPIILTSMFAQYDQGRFKKQMKEAEEIIVNASQGGKRDISIVNSRAHIDQLGECATDSIRGGGGCHFEGEPNMTRSAMNMHRCVGSQGGHPSLVVWDIIEELHRVLVQQHYKSGYEVA